MPLQVLALVFIRKLLDFIFTKRELSWLDDLMPEWKKKKLEDAAQEVQEQTIILDPGGFIVFIAVENIEFCFVFLQEEHSIIAEEEGIVQVPLEGHYK